MRPLLHQERWKKAALLCMMLGGAALIFGAAILPWAPIAIAVGLACFVAALILVFRAQSGSKG